MKEKLTSEQKMLLEKSTSFIIGYIQARYDNMPIMLNRKKVILQGH